MTHINGFTYQHVKTDNQQLDFIAGHRTLVQNRKTPNESDGFRWRAAEPANMVQIRRSMAC